MKRAIICAVLALVGCGLDGRLPPDPATAAERSSAAAASRVERALTALPELAAAHAVVVLPIDDPLAPGPRPPVRAAIALQVRPAADRATVRAAAEDAAHVILGRDAELAVTMFTVRPPGRDHRRAAAALLALGVAAAAIAVALTLARRRRSDGARAADYRGTRPQ